VRGDDLTLALIELRRASDRDPSHDLRARLARREARLEQRKGARRWWPVPVRTPAPGVRVWSRTSWHTLSGRWAADRPRR